MKRRVSRSELPKYIRIMILDFWKVLTVWSFGANKKKSLLTILFKLGFINGHKYKDRFLSHSSSGRHSR